MIYEVSIDGKNYQLELARDGEQWQCRLDGREIGIDAVLASPNVVSVLIDGQAYEIKREQTATDLHLWVGNGRYAVELRDPRSLQARRVKAGEAEGAKKLVAPMPGKIVRVLAAQGSEVQAGQGLVVMEAMKMQNEIKSPKKGKLQRVMVREGDSVNAGDALVIVE
jgi:biotin carboxyl carrier protein